MKNINEINDLIDARINILSKDIYRITLLQNKNNGEIDSSDFRLKNYLIDLEHELITLRSFINSKLDNSELKNCNYFKIIG